MEARVKVLSFGGGSNSYLAALHARVLGADTHYFMAINSESHVILGKRAKSSGTSVIESQSQTIATNTWYPLRSQVIGTQLYGYLNTSTTPLVSGSDGAIASGGVAVGTTNAAAEFDDIEVTHP